MAEIRNGRVTLRTSFEDVELADLEAGGASGSGRNHAVVCGGYFGRRRVGSLRNLGSFSTRSGSGIARFLCEPRPEDEGRTHFLDACALCKKLLGAHRDIFMYRGDMPFCSEECRQEQIDMDEAKEKNWSKLALKASSLKEPKTNTAQQTIQVQAAGAVVAG